MKDPLNYSLGDQKFPEASCCKYLEIIVRNDLRLADQVNYTVQKAWRVLHFVMRIVKKGNKNTKSLAYTSLVCPILKYGTACWDPYWEWQISAWGRVQNKAANNQQAWRKHTHTGKPHILLYNSQHPISPRLVNYNIDIIYYRQHTATNWNATKQAGWHVVIAQGTGTDPWWWSEDWRKHGGFLKLILSTHHRHF